MGLYGKIILQKRRHLCPNDLAKVYGIKCVPSFFELKNIGR
jgi:hypothetical protein